MKRKKFNSIIAFLFFLFCIVCGQEKYTVENDTNVEITEVKNDENISLLEEISTTKTEDIDNGTQNDFTSEDNTENIATFIEYNPEDYFSNIYEIEENDEIYNRIINKSYQINDNISYQDLRYLKMLYYDFNHEIQVGEMIVNSEIAEDVLDIFRELYEAEYEIQCMNLIDNYWAGNGDDTDTASIEANNTSCFCYREITSGSKLSNHALGRAIDINPQQNPYVSYKTGEAVWYHKNADKYIDRSSGQEHMIDQNDICYRIFMEHGFTWGGNWKTIKDYQHFEKTN